MENLSTIVCISESTYAGELTQSRSYAILARDGEKEQYRILNDRGRQRWYPSWCFAPPGIQPPNMSRFTIDDPIRDAEMDAVDVTIEFTDGTRRWCIFTTPRYAATIGTVLISKEGWSFRLFQGTPHIHLLSELHETLIEAALDHLNRQGGLMEGSLPLPGDE
jgi:hypothetical protein